MVRKAMLIDESKCTACRDCQVACKQWNDLEGWGYSKTANRGTYENPPHLSSQTWTRIKFNEYDGAEGFRWLFLKEGCMHCGDPACVRSCPTAALREKYAASRAIVGPGGGGTTRTVTFTVCGEFVASADVIVMSPV